MTTSAKEHYQAGRFEDAVAAQIAEVKAHPANSDMRGFLCELLSFGPNLDRVDKHLDVIGKQDPGAMLGVAEFRQVVRAAQARQDCFTQGLVPEFVGGKPDALMEMHLRALTLVREGDSSGAAALLAEAEEQRPRVRGTCDGKEFDEFRDLDDVTSAFFEVFTTTGKYFWIPVSQVSEVEFRAPERARDLLWRRAYMNVDDGPEGEVYVAALYPATHDTDDEQLRLGRATAWLGGEGEPVRGVGQRMYLVGEEARSILEIESVEFATGA